MRIVTITCSDCATIVAANELESNRAMKCPGLDCERELRFDDLPVEDREYVLEHRDRYRL
jgi:uncharacterized paraquat-inducible protein A